MQSIMANDLLAAKAFFREEYELNHFLGSLAKPHVALMDGIVMGGGAGVSVHGRFRIATEKTVFAMPECSIGLFPDVGGSHFLNALPGELGTYLGLTGTRLKGFEVVEAGLATHLVAAEKLVQLEECLHKASSKDLQDQANLERIFSSFQAESSEHTQSTGLLSILPGINECFRHDDVESIVEALQSREAGWAGWAKAASKLMAMGSPLSQKLTLRSLREGAGKSLATCLRTEFRMVCRVIDGPSDFQEGVRALLIEKGGKPTWRYSSLSQVKEEAVDSFFMPLADKDELHFHRSRQKPSKL